MDPETTPTSSRKIIPILIAAVLLAVIIVGIGYAAYMRFFSDGQPGISSYAECVQSVGSEVVGEGVCVTADGETFNLPPTPDGTQPVLVESSPVPVVVLIKDCPDEWVIEMEQVNTSGQFIDANGQPVTSGTSYTQSDEYFVVNGERKTRRQMDMDWIGISCDIEPTSVLK